MKSVLFVCLGNICRSPTAHAVFKHKIKTIQSNIRIDSAGTSASHIGESPDVRSVKTGERAGYDFTGIYSRQVLESDFELFDLIIAMDNQNYIDLLQLSSKQYHSKVKLLLSYNASTKLKQVPDPYYGGAKGFDNVLNLIEEAIDSLIELEFK